MYVSTLNSRSVQSEVARESYLGLRVCMATQYIRR